MSSIFCADSVNSIDRSCLAEDYLGFYVSEEVMEDSRIEDILQKWFPDFASGNYDMGRVLNIGFVSDSDCDSDPEVGELRDQATTAAGPGSSSTVQVHQPTSLEDQSSNGVEKTNETDEEESKVVILKTDDKEFEMIGERTSDDESELINRSIIALFLRRREETNYEESEQVVPEIDDEQCEPDRTILSLYNPDDRTYDEDSELSDRRIAGLYTPDEETSDEDTSDEGTSDEETSDEESEVVTEETVDDESEVVVSETDDEESEVVAEDTDDNESELHDCPILAILHTQMITITREGEGLRAAREYAEERAPPPFVYPLMHEPAHSLRGYKVRTAPYPALCVGGAMRRRRLRCRRDRRVASGNTRPLGYVQVEQLVANIQINGY